MNGCVLTKLSWNDHPPIGHAARQWWTGARRWVVVLVSCLVAVTAAQATEVTDTSQSSHAQRHAVGLSEVTWTNGFWADRYATCRDSSIPAMWELMRGEAYKPFYLHFLIAAGERPGRYRGAAWNDGDFYKWIESAVSVLAVQDNPELAAAVEQSIQAIAKAQRSDGYIHTPVLIANRQGDLSKQPFQDRHNFEMYNMGHLITAACLHHRVTGQDTFLRVAEKTAGFLEKTFANPTPELARNSVCPSHYMAMVELYRTTGKQRYLTLANTFLDMRNIVREGGDDNQDRMPFVEQREAIGHAVRANYLFAGAADLFLETGDARYRKSLDAIWQNVTEQKLYITGGCGALYDGASPDGSKNQKSITRVHQSYGRNYQLPNTTAHNETCAAIGGVLWNWRMYLATGESRYIDLLEKTLFNSVLSGVSLEGTDYFYVNPLRNEKPLPTNLRWSRQRVPFVTSYCCPPNVVRTIAQTNGYAYAKHDQTISVNLYGSSVLRTQLATGSVVLRQRTEYPWAPTVNLDWEAAPEEACTLELRVPAWCQEHSLQVNGDTLTSAVNANGYLAIERQWKAGDTVELRLEMSAVLMEAHPLVEETRNQVAVQRGPIVYCLESADLPEGVRVRNIALRADSEFTLQALEDLPGLTGLRTTAIHQPGERWQQRLYRPLASGDTRSIDVTLIPYFAWANRGEGEMSVWLPLQRD